MPTFDKLIKNAIVSSHPLLKGYRDLPKIREVMEKHAQDMDDPNSLNDLLTMRDHEDDEPKDINAMIYEASMLVSDVFNQFELPMLPKFFYETSRDVKYARNEENRIIAGSLIFGAEFRSVLGVRKRATVAVPISAGQLVSPSIMEIDGSIYTIAQSSMDDILQRNTTYQLPPVRDSYQQPPLDRTEREMAVAMRNELGYQPRRNPGGFYMNQKNVEASKKANFEEAKGWAAGAIQEMVSYLSDFRDGESNRSLAEMGVSFLSDLAESDFGAQIHSENYKYLVENFTTNLGFVEHPGGVNVTSFEEAFTSSALIQDVALAVSDIEESPEHHDMQASKKTAGGATPRMWAQVVEAMEKAEDDGLDTFPRPYVHVLRNYILDFVSTASKDGWEPHLINAGFCLNPYGGNMNRGRNRKAQNIKGDFDKEIEMEIEEPIEDLGVGALLDEEEKPEKDPRFYQDTKTPIEHGDGVKFNGPQGKGFQGTIVEIDEEGDFLIIKSKGMEYRVTVDSIQPIPSTFKKMYL